MSQTHVIDEFTFSLAPDDKTIIVFYKEAIADKYLANSAKQAKAVFEKIKKYQKVVFSPDLKSYCACTGKPCDPESWFCHRNFVAIRYLDEDRKCKGCFF